VTSRTVLVVDDESHILHVVSLKLGNAGYEVITAGDGEEGYELACQRLPDLIITDLQMPYMTGVEMCARLKRNKATASIPALLLTARGYALGAEDLQRTSIRHVLSKPFSPRELLDMIAEILGESTDEGKAREAA